MTDPATVRAVVRYLGLAALLLITINFLLLRQVISQGNGGGTIDAATLGAISSVSTLTGTVLGALGAVLVSTRTTSEPPPSDDADAGRVTVATVALVAIAIVVVLWAIGEVPR